MSDTSPTLNMDELATLMAQDEIEDAPLISPVNYAKIRPIAPQSVYYAIRTGKLIPVTCNCGRKCINKEDADDYFRKRKGAEAWPWGKERDADLRGS